jgi:hypothetical protein
MKTYLECWTRRPRRCSRRPWPGEPELVESLPKPLARARLALPPRWPETRGALRRGLDGSILESPLVGEGVDQKAGWGELLREVADAAAGELLAKTGKKCRSRSSRRSGESKVSRAFQLKSGDRAWTILVRDEVRAPSRRQPAGRPDSRRRTSRCPRRAPAARG